MKRIFMAVLTGCLFVAPAADARQRHAITDHQRIRVLQELVYQLRMQAKERDKAAADAPAFLKHAWPSLTGEEKDALAEVLRNVPKETKFDIVCNNADCNELALDIDDCLEKAGFESSLDHAMGPLGYGIAVQVNPFDEDKAQAVSAALKKASGGRLDLPVITAKPGTNAPGYVTILIGKRPRSETP